MAKRPALSNGETEVLKALWSVRQGGVRRIHAAVPAEREMDYTTVQTYVRRLEKKGYIESERVGRNKVYRPAVRRTQVRRDAVNEFLDRVFDGQLLPMIRHLVDDRSVTSDELDELEDIVESLRREQSDDE